MIVENQWKWVKVILDYLGVSDQSSKTRGYSNVIFSQLYRVYQLYNFMTFVIITSGKVDTVRDMSFLSRKRCSTVKF